MARTVPDNPGALIRPEAVAAAVDRHAASDAIFTTDTGVSSVWLARFITMTGTQRILGSLNLGSVANEMPQALGDLLTAAAYNPLVRSIVFNYGRLGPEDCRGSASRRPKISTLPCWKPCITVARCCSTS